MSDRSRRYAELFLVAGATAILTMAAPAVAAVVKHALFADNADKVDHKDAVSSTATLNARKGKLVATSATTGRLPNNIIKKARDSARLGGKAPSAYALASQVQALQARVAALEDKLQAVSFDPATKVLLITGANVQIVDGTGDTGSTPNGLGNLIIGYNEDTGTPNDRSGSHNLVFGTENAYSSFGGIVAGRFNTISGPFASVTGGEFNTASGDWSSVTGGEGNTASSSRQWVAGTLNVRTTTITAVPGGNEGNGSYESRADEAKCGAGELLLSGGAFWADSGVPFDSDTKEFSTVYSRVNSSVDGWRVRGGNDSGADHDLIIQALCYGP